VHAVLKEGLGSGFSLTGVNVDVVADAASAREAVRDAVENSECGILLLDEDLFSDMSGRERDALLQRTVPLVVLLPGEMRWIEVEEMARDDYVADLIRHAVGYQLNIRL
jgi:vacuolar-type H+-ATPase subunit F/Vma7